MEKTITSQTFQNDMNQLERLFAALICMKTQQVVHWNDALRTTLSGIKVALWLRKDEDTSLSSLSANQRS
jgi:hypothetical protein